MSNSDMTYQDLLQIIELIKSSSQFGEFHLKMGDLEIDLRRRDGGEAPASTPLPAAREDRAVAPAAAPRSAQLPAEAPATRQRHGHVGGGEIVVEPTASEPGEGAGDGSAEARQAPLAYPPGAVLIKSPMVGTFYRAPEPGARSFAEVGQRVAPDTTVCIIEVMKLMNSIPAGRAGIVTHVLVEDGEPVEYGQVLMVVDPD
ncbi:biotin/lipoyl-containing protein [Pandoraea sp.]|uniref:acetyl-CoA carboxylase biotin carboxyl carrier protein n=1 Tax=Pandoraea sp. TaxID=1883445 RepID=UPI0025CDE87E|nr:biotin/lipoyl-containing protein [Pandoraea sp.]